MQFGSHYFNLKAHPLDKSGYLMILESEYFVLTIFQTVF